MVLAVRSTAFRVETLALQRSVAQCTPEAGAVVVVVHRLHPAITGCDREIAGRTLGGEQFVPVELTVRQAVLQVERGVREYLLTVRAHEALRMVLFVDRDQAVALDSLVTLSTGRCEVQLKAGLAVENALLLDESAVLQRSSAVVTGEVLRTERLTQRNDERTSVGSIEDGVRKGVISIGF